MPTRTPTPPPAPTSASRRGRLWLVVAGVVVLLAVAAALGQQQSTAPHQPSAGTAATGSASPADEAAAPSPADLARRDPADPAALGDADAPLVLIEYADFRCKYCALFATDTLPALVEQYVDTGRLRIEWRDAPVLGGTSVDAAVAGRAAGQQGLFWAYYDALYAVTVEGKPEWTRDALLAAAREVPGLDEAAFTAALDDPSLRAAVQAETAESIGLGVASTPTFVVGEQVVQGARPLATFAQLIDAQLDGAS